MGKFLGVWKVGGGTPVDWRGCRASEGKLHSWPLSALGVRIAFKPLPSMQKMKFVDFSEPSASVAASS